MIVTRIYIKDNNKSPKGYVNSVILVEGKGIEGDIHSDGGEKQISIFTEEGRSFLDKYHQNGICTNLFQENITIKNMNIEKINVGDKLRIGNATLEITKIGKRCFPECNLIKTNNNCYLTKGLFYAKVISGGIISVNDYSYLPNTTMD